MPDNTQPSEPTPGQQWESLMGGDSAILKLSARITECNAKLEELDGQFEAARKQMLDTIVDVERWMARLDQAVEEWKIRKQDLFIQHFTTPLMDRGNKAISNYVRTRRFRAVSLRSQDAVRTQAQALLERMEKESTDPQQSSPQPNETQETRQPENPAAPSAQ